MKNPLRNMFGKKDTTLSPLDEFNLDFRSYAEFWNEQVHAITDFDSAIDAKRHFSKAKERANKLINGVKERFSVAFRDIGTQLLHKYQEDFINPQISNEEILANMTQGEINALLMAIMTPLRETAAHNAKIQEVDAALAELDVIMATYWKRDYRNLKQHENGKH